LSRIQNLFLFLFFCREETFMTHLAKFCAPCVNVCLKEDENLLQGPVVRRAPHCVPALPAVSAPQFVPAPLPNDFPPCPEAFSDEAPGSPGAPLPPPPGFEDDVWSTDMHKYVVEALLELSESWERVVEEDTQARQMVRVDKYISATEKRQREEKEAEEAEHKL
jgi:hypothetical protein